MGTAKTIVRAWFAAFNNHDPAAAAALYHADATNLQIPQGEPVRGREKIVDALRGLFQAFPDSRAEAENIFEDGEWAIVEWRLEGTLRGTFAGRAPTGRRFSLRGCEFFHVEREKIRLQRGYWDKNTWFRQIALPIE